MEDSLLAETAKRDRDETRRELRAAFIEALYLILDRQNIPQRQLRDDLGWSSHTYINRWRNLTKEPWPDEVFELERYLKLEPGQLSRHLGYLPPAAAKGRPGKVDYETVVTSDPVIPDWGKEILLTSYREIMRSLGRGRRR